MKLREGISKIKKHAAWPVLAIAALVLLSASLNAYETGGTLDISMEEIDTTGVGGARDRWALPQNSDVYMGVPYDLGIRICANGNTVDDFQIHVETGQYDNDSVSIQFYDPATDGWVDVNIVNGNGVIRYSDGMSLKEGDSMLLQLIIVHNYLGDVSLNFWAEYADEAL